MDQEIYFEENGIQVLSRVLEKLNPNRIFFVTGRQSFERSGAKSAIEPIITRFESFFFQNFSINPKLEDIENGIKLFSSKKYDVIIAIGGGSVIDIAKLINFFTPQKVLIEEYLKSYHGEILKPTPMIAIPTTAGSGSESTHFAVLYMNNVKFSVAHPYIKPQIVILDPVLTYSMNRKQTAITILDAFSQAVESFWSINSTDESRKYSKEAIGLIVENIDALVDNPNPIVRKKMLYAANLAGKAINIAKTTASHALSYILTSKYKIPHGHAVALTLGEVLLYNSKISKIDTNDPRGVDYVRGIINELIHLLNASNPEEAKDKIIQMMQNLGLETKLSDFGFSSVSIDEIVDSVNMQRLKNNPRFLNRAALHQILLNTL